MTTDFDQSLLDMTTPDREQQLRDAKERAVGPIPLIADPPSCLVLLPRGMFRNNEWQQEAEVRELVGIDEEALARIRDAVDFYDHVLALGTVRVGTEDLTQRPVSERLILLQELLLGERQQLLMAVIRVTYGDSKTLNVTCPNCQAEQEVDLIISEDFKPKVMDDPHKQTYSYTTSKGDNIEYRLVNGGDQNAALGKKGASPAEINSIILSRVITAVNNGLLPDPLGYARAMSLRDRTALLENLTNQQPSIDMTLTMPCVGCGGDQVLGLGWRDLFRP